MKHILNNMLKNHQLINLEVCVPHPKLWHQMIGSSQISKSKSKMPKSKIPKIRNSQIQQDPNSDLLFKVGTSMESAKTLKIGDGP